MSVTTAEKRAAPVRGPPVGARRRCERASTRGRGSPVRVKTSSIGGEADGVPAPRRATVCGTVLEQVGLTAKADTLTADGRAGVTKDDDDGVRFPYSGTPADAADLLAWLVAAGVKVAAFGPRESGREGWASGQHVREHPEARPFARGAKARRHRPMT